MPNLEKFFFRKSMKKFGMSIFGVKTKVVRSEILHILVGLTARGDPYLIVSWTFYFFVKLWGTGLGYWGTSLEYWGTSLVYWGTSLVYWGTSLVYWLSVQKNGQGVVFYLFISVVFFLIFGTVLFPFSGSRQGIVFLPFCIVFSTFFFAVV